MASLWMVFASFMFGAMGAAVKLASVTYSTSELMLYRGIIGTLMMAVLVAARGGTLRTPFAFEHLWRCGVGVTSLWMWFFAIGRLPLATAVTLNYLAPVWIAAWMLLLGWWSSGKRIEWPLIAAIAMSFAGVVLVLQPALASKQLLGGIMAVGSSVLTAMAYMQVRRLGQLGEPEYRVVFYFSLASVVAGFGGAFLEQRAPGLGAFTPHSARGLALLLAVGLCATVAQVAMTRAYRLGKVLVVANLQYTGIIFSSLWGMYLWDDKFDALVWFGMAVILVSGMAATFYNTRNTPRGAAVEKTDPIVSEV
jgi:drug/metabolite transporter (DMT)-like permease